MPIEFEGIQFVGHAREQCKGKEAWQQLTSFLKISLAAITPMQGVAQAQAQC